ncbi:MAG TPA: hypothetical protein VM884_08445 [Flavisolibacter sp.]|nr:hypothetical protein [Flavisolibacter sp.]
MRNIAQEFSFHFPLKHKVVRDLKIITEHVGDLEVEGIGYFDPSASALDIFDRYNVDIDFVKWNGADIKPVLEVTGAMDEIQEAAVRYFAGELENGMGKAA